MMSGSNLETYEVIDIAVAALKDAGFCLQASSQFDRDKARGIITAALVRLGEAQPMMRRKVPHETFRFEFDPPDTSGRRNVRAYVGDTCILAGAFAGRGLATEDARNQLLALLELS